MPSWLPSIPYPAAGDGYWGPVTSTLNWCEEDYYATIYSAEIVNTLTNLLFIFLGIKGITGCLKNGHDTIFVIAFCGYLTVGAGSFLFHSTLKYPMQLVDELSMIYTTCLMCFATFGFSQTRTFQIFLGSLLLGLAIFITAYYHYLQDPTFHQNAYALLTAIVIFRSMYVMEVNLRASHRKSTEQDRLEKAKLSSGVVSEEENLRINLRDGKILNEMWWMVGTGLSVFLGGFAIWTLDNELCSSLRRWRSEIGLPWGILLEGHGWWHLMTGLGAYFYIVWGIWLRHCLKKEQGDYTLVWPRIYNLPDVIRVSRKATGKKTI